MVVTDFQVYSLSPSEFENLIIDICRYVLGIGTINFSEGPDGGRDGRFEGIAQNFPSRSSPWSGKFIIQAKVNHNPIASCSDHKFMKELEKEIQKIKPLISKDNLDYYLYFTSRKLSANKESELIDKIKKETMIQDAKIIGQEWINQTLPHYPKIIDIHNLNKYKAPLRIFPQNLEKVILAFHDYIGTLRNPDTAPFNYEVNPNIDEKNKINNLSQEYFNYIQKNSLCYFKQIKEFLENPVNDKYLKNYYNFVEEINHKYNLKRDEFSKFEELFDLIYDQVNSNSKSLIEDSRLVIIFLHFMYYSCDIGDLPND